MNEWMFYNTQAQKINQLLGARLMVFKTDDWMFSDILSNIKTDKL